MQAPTAEAPPVAPEEGGGAVVEKATEFMLAALYENNAGAGAAKSIIRAKDKAEAMANYAYELAGVAIEKAGASSEDDIVPIAALALTEIGEIAQAVDPTVTDEMIAKAMSIMVLRFYGEMGIDTRQLQAAMDQYTPDMMKQAIQGAQENVGG